MKSKNILAKTTDRIQRQEGRLCLTLLREKKSRKGQAYRDALENNLPFVISETSEIVEPNGREGNFHTVTFCYLDKTLCIYVDHIPFDGTGFKAVLETFFYHYYCIVDKTTYDTPEGVYIYDAVKEQEVYAHYTFNLEDFEKGDEGMNMEYRESLKGVFSEQNIKMMCGIYRGICEGFTKAYAG